MNLFFAKYAFHPLILRGAEGEVAESMRKSHRIDIDSATQGKPSLQNDMIERRSRLVISRHEHDDPTLNLPDGYVFQGRRFPITF